MTDKQFEDFCLALEVDKNTYNKEIVREFINFAREGRRILNKGYFLAALEDIHTKRNN